MRSSELKKGLSSSDNLVGVEVDIEVSNLREVKVFSALGEECGLNIKTFSRFSQRFQFPEKVRDHLPRAEERACHFSPREVCFYEAAFLCGLRFPVHPFIIELLNHFIIAPRQLMLNSWRIMVSCMEIWLATIEGDMIRMDEFIHLYRLKESKEYR